MKYYIFTLGCQMNIADSEKLSAILDAQGLQESVEKDADLIVVNACSVRQKAVDRIWGGIKKWKAAKKKVIISGCVLPADKKKLKDRGIEYKSIDDLGKIDNTKRSGKIAYITIMTGCDNFCSYCAVPYTRGREKSRLPKVIIKDINKALGDGFKNILLLGQNVNSFKYDFAKLLLKIDALEDNFKFNFMSSNPHDMTDNIINAFSKLKKWPKELHLAMQSGDDEILKKMNRKYTSRQYLDLVTKLKKKIPDLSITTDIIVGFPTETKTQFNNTVKVCKKVGFKKAYIGQYSPREGTVSANLKDDVPAEEKKRRWEVLNELINS